MTAADIAAKAGRTKASTVSWLGRSGVPSRIIRVHAPGVGLRSVRIYKVS